ncbi:MAG TPA: acylphosphatase [Solirubrobacterales bacterium]
MTEKSKAIRGVARGKVQGVFFRDTTMRKALELGVSGWVRNARDGTVVVHAEGPEAAVGALLEFLAEGPPGARVDGVEVEPAKVEGHEQFAVRGVSAGAFVVAERSAPARGFELRLEVGGKMRSWAVPRGPSMDPAAKRLAIEAEGRAPDQDDLVWDHGTYEQGGRVPWPEALERGQAVFVLHGEKLEGGFALQRTRQGEKPQWLLIKRRDEFARPGSDG